VSVNQLGATRKGLPCDQGVLDLGACTLSAKAAAREFNDYVADPTAGKEEGSAEKGASVPNRGRGTKCLVNDFVFLCGRSGISSVDRP
jgi:hypothetical protein